MADTAGFLSCNYGTSLLDLVSYNVDEQPILSPQTGQRTGTRVVVACECQLRCADQTAMQSGLVAAMNDLRSNGRDLIINGLGGGLEYQLLSAQCRYSGPYVDFTIGDGDAPLVKKITLKVSAETLPPGSLNIPTDSFSVSTVTRPDGLMTVSRRGTVNGVNTPAFLLGTIFPSFQRAYPIGFWVTDITWEASQDGNQSKLTYTMTARQNFEPLPNGGADLAVDGDASVSIERDEQMRKMTTYDFDLLVIGDPYRLINEIRPKDKVILHERWHVTQVKENRLQCTFTVLESADVLHVWLTNFSQTASVIQDHDLWEEKTYIGADPILVKKPKTFPRLRQSGSATALDAFFSAPGPMLPALAEQPSIGFEETGTTEKRTNWSYEAFAVDDTGAPISSSSLPDFTKLLRDDQPDDYTWEKPGP